MQNLTSLFKNFWLKSQLPDREPSKFSKIDKLIIFLVCIVIAIISSHKLLTNYPNDFGTIFEWLVTFVEVLVSCGLLILISKKENPMINSRQILLIIGLLLLSQFIKVNFDNISPLVIVIPPALIISQGMGTLTALSWVSMAFINWPASVEGINNYLLVVTFICACVVSFLGGRIRNRAQFLQIAFLVPLGAFLSQLVLVGGNNQNTNLLNSSKLFLSKGDLFSDSLFLSILLLVIILLMPIFESTFGLLTKSRLLELADQEKPLLRRLSIQAPGTFEHTLLICCLAEEATRTIGGDVDLIKTGALYHDIGKLHAPNWFIENQDGKSNPHEELNDPFKSAEILQEHVDQGLIFARKNRLPQAIANFIPEHQGTLKMGYFLHKAKEKDINISDDKFRYKGPIPQSKETAILMLADGCEAALRAMNIEASDKEALHIISKIITSREKDRQLVDSQLSKSEIFLIKRSFLNVWKRIRHRRIQYPTTENNTFS
ncbi:MAG: phosphodiesterase [Prochlorococcus sp. SP3034]|nr:phosphodiesterase [Prochlorococcus sp. SP3034]